MISTIFNSKEGFLDVRYIGDIKKQDLIKYIDATRENTDYPRRLKILTDSSKANMILSRTDLLEVVEANLKSLKRYSNIIDAIVTLTPKETAFSVMYKKLSSTKKYRFEVFSTRAAALEWLDMQ